MDALYNFLLQIETNVRQIHAETGDRASMALIAIHAAVQLASRGLIVRQVKRKLIYSPLQKYEIFLYGAPHLKKIIFCSFKI